MSQYKADHKAKQSKDDQKKEDVECKRTEDAPKPLARPNFPIVIKRNPVVITTDGQTEVAKGIEGSTETKLLSEESKLPENDNSRAPVDQPIQGEILEAFPAAQSNLKSAAERQKELEAKL